jgi:hypothetical protein
MPIRNQIESVVQMLTGSPAFIYGTVNELNALADDAELFPCVFMYPLQPIEVSPQINGSVNNTFSVAILQQQVNEIRIQKPIKNK